MKIDLWPTTIAVEHFPKDFCLEVVSNFAIADDKEWDKVLTESQVKMILAAASQNFGTEYEVIDGWVRIVPPGGNNDFEIHSDSHYGGDLVGVLFVQGDQDAGGNLTMFDPAWRNPQRVSDSVNPNVNKYVNQFEVGKFIMFPADVWHSVSPYYGSTKRITLNLVLKRK